MHPNACVSVCSQTSVYENTSCLSENKCKINWIEYIKNFKIFNHKINLKDFNYLK